MSVVFLRFVLAGIAAAVVNVVSRICLGYIFSFNVSVIFSFILGFSAAFFMNRTYVFRSNERRAASQYIRFVFVNLVALAQVWAVSVALLHFVFPRLGFFWHTETVAHVIGVASPVLTSYLGHKHFTFRRAAAAG